MATDLNAQSPEGGIKSGSIQLFNRSAFDDYEKSTKCWWAGNAHPATSSNFMAIMGVGQAVPSCSWADESNSFSVEQRFDAPSRNQSARCRPSLPPNIFVARQIDRALQVGRNVNQFVSKPLLSDLVIGNRRKLEFQIRIKLVRVDSDIGRCVLNILHGNRGS